MNNKPNVIIDKDDSEGFEVDWDTIEKEYRKSKRGRHRHGRNSSSSDSKSSGKKTKKKKILIGILIFLAVLILSAITAFFILRHIGMEHMTTHKLNMTVPDFVEDYKDGGKTLVYKGHTYQFNEDLSSVLFMGIDNTELKENAVSGTAGQADALYLLVYNLKTGKIRTLSINRDTLVDINLYNEVGDYKGSVRQQICLAYAFGDGKKSSAQNQVRSVERLLHNIPINGYFAIDLSAIKILNDDIGGVTVTPNTSFGEFTAGQTVTLKGDMAEKFVRTRDTSLLDDNLRRMEFQKLYLTSFANQIVPSIKKDFSVPMKLYNDSSEYSVTDIGIPEMIFLSSSLATRYSGLDLVGTKGAYKLRKEDSSAQYILDQEAFFETLLDLFYKKVE